MAALVSDAIVSVGFVCGLFVAYVIYDFFKTVSDMR